MLKTEAIVLRRQDLKERDKLLTLYTQEYGKLRVRAVGAKKIDSKLGGHLEPFMRTEVCLVPSKTIDIVAGAQVVDAYMRLRASVSGMHAAQYLVEVLDCLTPDGQSEKTVYNLTRETLEFLNQQTPVNFFTVQSVALKILGHLGFEPELERCVHCGKLFDPTGEEETRFFQAETGGIVHRTCVAEHLSSEPIHLETIKAMRFALRSPIKQLATLRVSQSIWQQVNTCIDQLLDIHGKRPLRSRVFLGQLV